MRDIRNPVWNDAQANAHNPQDKREPNIPLLRKTLEHITAHPEEWDQETWATQTPCGTTACLAGWAVTFAGHELVWDEEDPGDRFCDCENCLAEGPRASQCIVDGYPRSIHNAATHALGLTLSQSNTLFYGGNSLGYLWACANSFTNGEIEIPTEISG